MTSDESSNNPSFSEKMTDILNFGAINLAMAIGYRTGLFEIMDMFDTPQTVSRISDKAGLNPRYVMEWLGVMVTAKIVDASRDEHGELLYYLPKHHGDFLTRRAGNSNLGVYTQEIPLLTACAMENVIHGFTTGRGVAYDHYPKFQAFMSELANAKHRQVLVNTFLPSVDDGKLIQRLDQGIRVCDVGCAQGVATILMAGAFPNSKFVGIDISSDAIKTAQKEAQRQQINNLKFEIMDAATLKANQRYKELFNYVTAFDAIHDQIRPLEVLQGIYTILAHGGAFSMVDIAAQTDLLENIDHPMGPFLYTVSLMHCMPVGLVNGGTGLGMMWGQEKAVQMLKNAGFQEVQVKAIPHDAFNLHYFCRKGLCRR